MIMKMILELVTKHSVQITDYYSFDLRMNVGKTKIWFQENFWASFLA